MGSKVKRGSVAVSSVAVALAASLGTFLVALLHSSGASMAVVSAAGGVAVGASAVTGALSIRYQPPIPPMWEEGRWAFSVGALLLQVAGASAWLVGAGPWPPALAAFSVGAGLLATIPLAPPRPRIIDVRDVPSTELIPGFGRQELAPEDSPTAEFLPQNSVSHAVRRSRTPRRTDSEH